VRREYVSVPDPAGSVHNLPPGSGFLLLYKKQDENSEKNINVGSKK
jgi:hypothetical protein